MVSRCIWRVWYIHIRSHKMLEVCACVCVCVRINSIATHKIDRVLLKCYCRIGFNGFVEKKSTQTICLLKTISILRNNWTAVYSIIPTYMFTWKPPVSISLSFCASHVFCIWVRLCMAVQFGEWIQFFL